MVPMKYITANMYMVLSTVCTSKSVPIQELHILTTAALMARGAIALEAKTGVPGVKVVPTPAGRALLNWADKGKFKPYKETRPIVHDAKVTSLKE